MELSETAPRAERSPFPGLAAFTASEDDAAVFAGRDAEIELVAANLRAASLTILYGPSGVGKSSLLRAGVVRRVQQPPRRGRSAPSRAPTVVVHDEWAGNAGEALSRTVAAALRNGGADDDPRLDVALERWAAQRSGPLLIILDQFEEYLHLHNEPDHDSFDRSFARSAGRDDLPVHFLLSLRDDALSDLDRYQGRMPGLFDNYLRLPHMDEACARAAIVQPIARVNEWRQEAGLATVQIQDGLVDEIFSDLTDPTLLSGQRGVRSAAGRAPIELAFLQLVMRRLWEADVTGDSPVLKISTLHELGGTDTIVAGHLDAQMRTLTREQRDTAAAMFSYLVTPSGAKIRYTARDLAGYAHRPPQAVAGVLEALSRPDLRIMRRVPAPSGDAQDFGYEIFHDVLAGAVRGWGLRNRAARLERQSRRLGGALAAAIAALVAVFAYAVHVGPLERLDLRTVDMRFGLRGVADVDPRILLVGIDDRTLASSIRQPSPKPPVSRADQALVLNAIDAGGPTAIVEDIEYQGPGDPRQTEQLKAALRERTASSKPVVLATSRIDDAGQTTLFGDEDHPLNDRTSKQRLHAVIGYSGLPPDADGVLRHVRDQGRQGDQSRHAAVGLFGLPTIAVRAAQLSGAPRHRFPAAGAWIDYAGGPGTYPQVSLVDVRNGRVPAARFHDKIVVVGKTSLKADDVHPTPAGGGRRMSGPEIQANAIATARAGLPLRDAPAWAAVLLILAMAIVPAALTVRCRTLVALGFSALTAAIFLVGAQLAFGAGWIVPVVMPLLALVLAILTSQVSTLVWPGARGGLDGRSMIAPCVARRLSR